ncbi:MAG: hypothetical protein A2821_00115 [Candidatus Magasanikbacteria bacterium RIFCSPHIGHO2_01_FULL_41_23]|uniref:Glycosyltransferase 2-like domain-containing protein n=1 Tax=Candidatus Magasanikbacteria bacterium RIFCSPLOWO2_01_FULL_40_15 TaxID=1798686 RepID=A0A1F6N3L5_9BACT|nr:MAG: hypothetical protein A2821_00115 [Candidatus Magasanikbacteria bacterium RIFCSPHIGHO2_01_FULL_41_23]OGH76598.1 MAG: hypothetical protein A3F22_04655 [Candidatus Magasanikbacteria bacterium RIFCSPHIGHO2_12_FULL_41_16]OGH78576.1 MAG: hypothetical protein A2983_02855 [Candidatus Magasanikbacteria bacterium RIFCSPLOWO2_01_FULL_40_15]
MQPLVSIIIPVFNRPEIFERSLASALSQTYKNTEIIVVDDGSNPAISTNKPGVQLFRQDNKGAPSARNFGFFKSKGEFVIFWDADTIAESDALEKMVLTLHNSPSASYVYSDFYFGNKKMPAREFDADALKKNNFVTITTLIRRADFSGFDESLKRFQDWDLWLTMLEKNKTGVYVPEYLFKVIDLKGTISSWLPSFCYQAPWKWLPLIRSKVKKYEDSKKIIGRKHNLVKW